MKSKQALVRAVAVSQARESAMMTCFRLPQCLSSLVHPPLHRIIPASTNLKRLCRLVPRSKLRAITGIANVVFGWVTTYVTDDIDS
jgi:hypothetical protein